MFSTRCCVSLLFATLLLLLNSAHARLVGRGRNLANEDARSTNLAAATPYNVTLAFALYYVNSDFADEFETNLSNPGKSDLVASFCRAVNFQASGAEVQESIEGSSFVIDTTVHELNSGSSSVYGCRILQSLRRYDQGGQDTLGEGFFTFEVEVEQTVFVLSKSSATPLSNRQVETLVQRGFLRGSGGRASFRRLLQRHPGFFSLLNSEFLREGISSAPPTLVPTTAIPTSPPTGLPTAAPMTLGKEEVQPRVPTPNPTLRRVRTPEPTVDQTEPTAKVLRTVEPSVEPTKGPSPTRQPSSMPTKAPSPSPTAYPSAFPTTMASLAPSFVPSHQPSVGPSELPSLVPSTKPSEMSSGLPSSNPSTMPSKVPASSRDPVARPDDNKITTPSTFAAADGANWGESQSNKSLIAGSIVGGVGTVIVSCFFVFCVLPFCRKKTPADESPPRQTTAGRDKRPRTNGDTLVPPHIRLDDLSIVTTPKSKTDKNELFRITSIHNPAAHENVINNADSFDDSSLYTSTTSVVGSHYSGQVIQKPKEGSSDVRYHGPVDVDQMDDDSVRPTDGMESYPFFAVLKGDASVNGRTKASRSMPTNPLPRSSMDAWSVQRKEHKQNGTKTQNNDDDGSFDAASGSFGVSSGSGNSPAPLVKNLVLPDTDANPSTSNATKNNSLLRRVLEDARKLSISREKSSVASFKSAPSLISKSVVSVSTTGGRGYGTPSGLLTEHLKLEKAISLASGKNSSSKSVGWNAPSKKNTFEFSWAKSQSSEHELVRTTPKADGVLKKSLLEGGDDKDDISPPPTPQTPNPISPNGVLGAHVRDDNWTTTPSEEKQADSPASSNLTSPGVLGIACRPLGNKVVEGSSSSSSSSEGSRAYTARSSHSRLGTDSVGGKSALSSTTGYMSAGSVGTSQKTVFSLREPETSDLDRFLLQAESGSRQSSTAPTVDNSVNQKSVKSVNALEQDVKRLGQQIANVLQGHTTSSITSNSVGSRSRSSRSKRKNRLNQHRRMVVVVPPGKLGVVLVNEKDGRGTTVSEVRSSSSMQGLLKPGDKLVAVDEEDVTDMVVSDITRLMAARASAHRRLTVITTSGTVQLQEAKLDE